MQLDNKIAQLKGMERSELIAEWSELCGDDPPEFLSDNLIIRILAYKFQIREYGDLTLANQNSLKEMIQTFKADPRSLCPRTSMKIGTRLYRTWQGKIYEVIRIHDGFIYDGIRYGNLSEIAKIITGTHWNGTKFFGLRPAQKFGKL